MAELEDALATRLSWTLPAVDALGRCLPFSPLIYSPCSAVLFVWDKARGSLWFAALNSRFPRLPDKPAVPLR